MAEEFRVSLGLELKSGDIDNIRSQINDIKVSPIKLTMNTKNIQNQINSIKTQIQNLSNIKINLTGVNSNTGVQKTVSDVTKAYNNISNIQKRIKSINIKFDDGTFTNDMNKVTMSLSKINTQSDEVASGMQKLNAAFAAMKTAKNQNDIDGLIASYEQYKIALKNVKNQIEINQRVERQNIDASKLANAKKNFSYTMEIWLKDNSAAAKQFGSEIEALRAKLDSCDAVQFDGIKSEFNDITKRAELAGKATQTFGDRLKEQMSKLGTYFSASMIITEGVQAMRAMCNNVIEVDTAMTGLYRVTDLTATQYNMLYDNMIASAKEYGATLTDIINSTADWVRLGFDANEANQLSGITAMYQHISDLDYDVAVENLVTAYKGFQDQLSNLYNGDQVAAISYIADIFNELDNTYAVTADNIGAALTKSASALNMAGNTIQESAAMITGITEVTQDPEKAGSALKVLSLRLRGMKGELEELGEDVDENVDSLSKMQTQILNITKGKVNIFNDDGSFKSTYEMMDEIADIYYDLTSTEQADLLETIAGKNRANDVAALISNWNQVEAAMTSAMNAEGSAAEENKKYMDSIQGRLDSLTTSWQAFSNTVVNSDFVKIIISSLTEVLDFLDIVIENFGTLNTVIAGFSITKAFQGISSTVKAFGGLSSYIGQVKSFSDVITLLGTNASGTSNIFGKLVSSISTHPYIALAAAVGGIAVAAFDALHVSAEEATEAMEESFNEYEESKKKISDVNSELLTAQQRMSELESKAGLTFVEESELAKLRESTELLQIQADLAEKEAIAKGKEAADSAATAYEKNFTHEISKDKTDEYIGTAKATGNNASLISDTSNVSSMIAYIKQMKEVLKETEKGSEDWETINENIGYATDAVWEQASILTGYKENLTSIPFEYLSDDAKTALESVSNAIEYIYKELDPAKWQQIKFDEIFKDEDLKNAKSNLIELAKQNKNVGITVDDVKNSYPELVSAIEGAGFTVQDFVDNINSEANVTIKVNTELENDVSKFTEEQKKKVIDSFKDNSITQWFNSLSPDEKELVYKIGVESDNTNLWTLTQWKQEFTDMSESGKTSAESIQLFYDTLNNTDDGNFSDTINSYVSDITTLKEALLNIDELTDEDILDLAMEFPSLVGKTGDVETLSEAIAELIVETQTGLDGKFNEQLEALGGSSTSAGQALLSLKAMIDSVNAIGFDFDIDKEIEKFNNLYDAVKESVSGTGLSTEGIKNIEKMFSGLDGYDQSVLFERTEHGIHLNTSALRALQSQYESINKLDIQNRLQDLKQEYNDSTRAVDGLTKGTEEYNAALKKAGVRDTSAILEDISNVQILAAQYEGLTSAYNKWIMAQSSGEEGDMYDNITGSLKDIKQLYNDGLVGTNAFRSAVQMMTDEDLSTASIDKLISTYEDGYPLMQRYFTDGQKGCVKFLKDVQSLGNGWASMNKDGTWEINFGEGNDAAIAQAISDMLGLQMSTEQVQIILRKLSDYGFDIKLDSAYSSIDELQSRIEKTEEKLFEVCGSDWTVCCDIYCDDTELDTEIEKAKSELEYLSGLKSTPEIQARTADAEARLDYLAKRKVELEQPAFMSVNVSDVDSGIQNALTILQKYQTAVNSLKILELKGADTSEIEAAQTKVNELASDIQKLPDDVKTTIGLKTDGDIESIKNQIANGEVTVTVTADTSPAKTDIENVDGADVKINVTVSDSGTAEINALKDAINGIENKNVKISVKTSGLTSIGLLSSAIAIIKNKDVSIKATTTGKSDAEALADAIKSLTSKNITAKATTVGKSDIDNLKSSVDSMDGKTIDIKIKTSNESGIGNLKNAIDALSGKSIAAKASVSGTDAVKKLKAAIDALHNKTIYITTVTRTVAGANGTAHANGTAYARGNWGTKDSGIALGGELGQELVVRDGRWFTIGDKSAEFFTYKKGDIIFNAAQTEQIFRQGKITRGNGRGKALAEGTAYAEGTAFSSGSGRIGIGGAPNKDKEKAKDKSKNEDKKFKETFDWIEIALDRVERAINSLDKKTNSVYKSWSNRNKSLKKEMSTIRESIELQEDAYNRYMKEANKVGLSSYMAELVRNGAIDIDTVENEELAEQIKEYQEW